MSESFLKVPSPYKTWLGKTKQTAVFLNQEFAFGLVLLGNLDKRFGCTEIDLLKCKLNNNLKKKTFC